MTKRNNVLPYEPVGRLIEGAGAARVSQDAKVALVEHLTKYATQIGKLAVKYASHANRTTVTAEDIKLAEKNS
jgi:histone H3/H4